MSNKGRVSEYPRANELVSLHEINEQATSCFYFDGVIRYAGRRRYVQKVPFEMLSIGGYEEPERSTVGSEIWIQSAEGTRCDVWYRLRTPAAEYRRYHEPFLWLADLAKHTVDYLQAHQLVRLDDFRNRFYEWLQGLYLHNEPVRCWLRQYPDHDFRRIIAAQANFLYFQAHQVGQEYVKHPLWEEIHSKILRAIPEQVERSTKQDMYAASQEGNDMVSRRKTTVTPYVFQCFKGLPWAKFLYSQTPSVSLARGISKKAAVAKMLEVRVAAGRRSSLPVAPKEPFNVNIGDVVAIPKDDNSAWKTDDKDYLGYVQGVYDTDRGQALRLLWFYRPGDTTCLKMFYPHSQEIFLSDHCNCGDSPVLTSEVIRKPQVTFFVGPEDPHAEFFCRQRYINGDCAWITLQDTHFRCGCNDSTETVKYSIGDTLLVASSLRKSAKSLEPVVLLEFDPDGLVGQIKVLRLSRKGRDYGCNKAAPNELVLTDRSEVIPLTYVQRPCQVRFYSEAEKEGQKIPCPYDRRGASDFYYITSKDLETSGCGFEALQKPWPSFIRQGWDPTSIPPQPKMRALDLFSGMGNFGRGLEEGGAISVIGAVDWYSEAIHTYKANMPIQNETKMFRGSVNHYLCLALEGKEINLVAQLGEVEFICAGSPCQGFSLANPSTGNEGGLLNESMVASVLAFIDFYRPKYALMENVKGMAWGDKSHNVLAQVRCCLVGMGYQVQAWCLDAWTSGSPQSRSRIIISITAPGLEPMKEPALTHSHPDGVCGGSLGKTANGLHTASRTTSRTPFDYVTSAEATKDLPTTDARTTCIPFPDHRMSKTLPITNWVRVSSIPRFPSGCTFVKAFKQGYMPQVQIDSFNWEEKVRSRDDSKCWQRVSRNGLMPTVMTCPRPEDGCGGTCLHWSDHRLLTIMEVRRAQGIPDNEVIIGSPSEQWKIIGNSVARPMALALGVSLRTAWLANTAKQEPAPTPVNVALKHNVIGKDVDHKTEMSTAAASGEVAPVGWSKKEMLNKLTSALSSPKALISVISDTIGQPLTNGCQYLATTPGSQTLKHVDAVKTGLEKSEVSTIGSSGTSRLKPYRFEDYEDTSASEVSTTLGQSVHTDYAGEGCLLSF